VPDINLLDEPTGGMRGKVVVANGGGVDFGIEGMEMDLFNPTFVPREGRFFDVRCPRGEL